MDEGLGAAGAGEPVDAGTELQGAEWKTDERGLGAVFEGHNKLGDMEWSLDNHITAYEEGRVFEWSTVDPASPGGRWRFEIMDQGVGSRLRFSVEIGMENNLTYPMAMDAPDPVAVLNGRRKGMKANMQKTLEAVKAKVESS